MPEDKGVQVGEQESNIVQYNAILLRNIITEIEWRPAMEGMHKTKEGTGFCLQAVLPVLVKNPEDGVYNVGHLRGKDVSTIYADFFPTN